MGRAGRVGGGRGPSLKGLRLIVSLSTATPNDSHMQEK